MLPRHVAFIMDGNGRWAKSRGLPRHAGHKKGADVLEKVCDRLDVLGVKYASFYAFSTENWSRPDDEVKKLMALLRSMVKKALPKLIKRQVKLTVSGDLFSDKVSKAGREATLDTIEKTKDLKNGTINICFNYGAKSEIVHAVNLALEKGLPITEETISQNLWVPELPEVDLVIRTSGEQRLSNFMLWQSAYAEIYFTDCLWPDFGDDELDAAINWFSERKRRFGGL